MYIEQAMGQLFKRMANGQYKPTQYDLDCVKFIANWVNREKEKLLNEHKMFSKIYVYAFIHELEYYKNIDLAQKRLHEILAYPVEKQFKDFSDTYNRIKFNKYTESIEVSQTASIVPLSKEKELKDQDIIRNNALEFEKYLNGVDYDKIRQSLNNQISEAINLFKNKP